MRVLGDFMQLATASEQIVSDFIGGIVDDVAPKLSTDELVRLKTVAGRLERACSLALQCRPD
jgi:hypothetical protein